MDITKQIAEELQVRAGQVDAAIKLLDEGNTVPFISANSQRQSRRQSGLRLLRHRQNLFRPHRLLLPLLLIQDSSL